jgi:2-methylisocitrate lyase-like PEP mutase family enzyme
MNSDFNRFRELHLQDEPLLLPNAWDAQSAKLFEKQQFKALATSSMAVAGILGYADGENMPFEEYLLMIRRIRASVSLPFTVDMETGYGKTAEEIADRFEQLYKLGIAGVNIEDSVINSNGRSIDDPVAFGKKLGHIISLLQQRKVELFINVRSDAFLLRLPGARKEALKRITIYEKTGAHGIFLPCITDIDDIKAVTAASSLPINVMCMPDLPAFAALQSAGVKRISMAAFVNQAVYKNVEILSKKMVEEGSFACLFR